MIPRFTIPILVAGAIAQALAAKDKDIEAARVAYDEQRFESAMASLQSAQERRGDRPEIAFDMGLLAMTQEDGESAKKYFERASESGEATLRASANFELGNLAFDTKDWASAIEHYIECLKEAPLHEDAKWNLELALSKQEEEEKKKKEEQEKNKDNKDKEPDEDQEKQEDKPEDEEQQDDQEESEESGSSSSGGEESSQEDNGEGTSTTGEDESSDAQDGQGSSGEEDESSSDAQGQDEGQSTAEPEPEPEDKDGQAPEEQDPEPSQPSAPPKSNLDRALEDLDREDPFVFGMPKGRRRPVKEDW